MQQQITKKPHSKHSLFTLLLAVSLMQGACAQDKKLVDSTLSTELNNQNNLELQQKKADRLIDNNEYLKGIKILEKILVIKERGNIDAIEQIDRTLSLAVLYSHIEQLNEAQSFAQKAYLMAQQKFGNKSVDAAQVSITLAGIYRKLKKTTEGLAILDLNLETLQQDNKPKWLARTYLEYARLNFIEQNFDIADKYFLMAAYEFEKIKKINKSTSAQPQQPVRITIQINPAISEWVMYYSLMGDDKKLKQIEQHFKKINQGE